MPCLKVFLYRTILYSAFLVPVQNHQMVAAPNMVAWTRVVRVLHLFLCDSYTVFGHITTLTSCYLDIRRE